MPLIRQGCRWPSASPVDESGTRMRAGKFGGSTVARHFFARRYGPSVLPFARRSLGGRLSGAIPAPSAVARITTNSRA
jgi:hypothetical protein